MYTCVSHYAGRLRSPLGLWLVSTMDHLPLLGGKVSIKWRIFHELSCNLMTWNHKLKTWHFHAWKIHLMPTFPHDIIMVNDSVYVSTTRHMCMCNVARNVSPSEVASDWLHGYLFCWRLANFGVTSCSLNQALQLPSTYCLICDFVSLSLWHIRLALIQITVSVRASVCHGCGRY